MRYLKDGFGYDDIYKIWINKELYAQEENKSLLTEKPAEKPTEPVKEVTREIPEDVVKLLTDSQTLKKPEETYTLHTLFFEFNSAELSVTSTKELDYLAMIMKNLQ